MTKVIDISYAQTGIDFGEIKKAGVNSVVIRNGYYGKTDTAFKSHMTAAIAAGMHIGSYTYIMSETVDEAIVEAQEAIKRLEPYKKYIDMPVWADMESDKYIVKGNTYDRISRTDIISAFCKTIAAAGYKPGVYINPAWLEQYVIKSAVLSIGNLWLAAWTGSPDKATKYDYGQAMWQWGTSTIDGMDVDSDLCYVDYQPPKKAVTSTASAATKTSTFKVGDYVKVTKNATTYSGTSKLAPFVYLQMYKIMQVGTTGKPDYIVIGDGKRITAAVKAKDLIKQ